VSDAADDGRSVEGGPPFDPRLDRYRPLTRGLNASLVLCVALAAAAVVLPAPAGRWSGIAAVAVLIVVPLLRVVWLVQRWLRRGDRRFALVGTGVLLVIGAGVGLAAAGV
jgi:membrane protein YdbS with pleckstrin-like domain